MILDGDEHEVMRAGRYYKEGLTNNIMKSFALYSALDCLTKFVIDPMHNVLSMCSGIARSLSTL